MSVLLDTCVLSELRHAKGNRRVKTAVNALPDDALFLSVITLGEIAKGVARLQSGDRKTQLSQWLQSLRQHHDQRILPVDAPVALLWGELTAQAQQDGVVLGACDGLIAATAIQHGLQVMTRNVADFAPTGARILDPWAP